ncbi:DUF3383 family protein [Pectinatus frisingensis]|uniref:DUF3383 family protein n=1 Tax=Pectinatus frisingensis TaxID=865 RepID=UPI0018C57847|nr:DUF3383 family protein [Pectinatus frisingensis]
MAKLSDIANVDISLDTSGITEEGFSTILIAALHAHSLNRVDSISSVDDLVDLGFETTDPAYYAATSAFSQTPAPDTVKIGRINPSQAEVTVGTVSATGVYTATISTKDSSGNVTNTPYAYTNASGDAAAILDGIEALIAADATSKVTAAVSGTTMTLTPKTAGDSIKYAVSSNLDLAFTTFTETIAEAMAAITAEDSDFYGIVLADRTQANILAMAEWTETQKKLFGTSTAEAGAIDASVSSDTASELSATNYYRTHYWYHAKAETEYLEAAIMAKCFNSNPGTINWANKTLSGITKDNLTTTQRNAVHKKNGNTFEPMRSLSLTFNGKVAAGEWIDIIRGRDWLSEDMAVNVANVIVNMKKVDYTNAGIAKIEAAMKITLELGVSRGFIAPVEYDSSNNKNPSYTITVPLASDISANTKASRILSDMSFTARLAGAINVVNISGSLTYNSLATTDDSTAS